MSEKQNLVDIQDLEKSLYDLRKEQLDLRIKHVHKQLNNTAQLRVVRRNIARIKTQMTALSVKGKKND